MIVKQLVLMSLLLTPNLSAALNYFLTFDKVQFIFIHGTKPSNNTRYTFNDLVSLINHEHFDLQRKTVLFIHGWIDDFHSEGTQLIARSYIERNDHNQIVLDWGQYSFSSIALAVHRSSIISKLTGQMLIKLFEHGLNANNFHCVGHSIGAHMCGITGREVMKSGHYKLKRITALDAAFPYYYPAISGQPLSPSDAIYVDAIHTDTFFVGTPYRVAHTDYYVNGGNVQSGCPDLQVLDFVNNYCSHFQSWRYWSKSLTSKKLYPAKRCKSWRDFKSGRCDNNPTNFMGYNSLPIEGVFFNEIKANRSYFQGVNAEIYNYVASSFNNRSTIAQFLKKLNVLL